MNYFESQLANCIDLSVAPVFVNSRRRFVIKTHRRPLRARNTDPSRLLRQASVNRLVCRVDDYFRVRLSFLQAGDTAHVIHVRMSAGDRLEVEAVSIDGAANLV